jgi:glutamate synthase (NADPH/NADH) small chain
VETERADERKTIYKEDTEFELDADLVLLAIGFTGPVRDRLLDDLNLEFGNRGAIAAPEGYATGVPNVFVAGDAKLGADLIVTAIAEGRKAARHVDQHLMGRSLLPG